MGEARIRVSIPNGLIEIEGTEKFVSAQIELFRPLIDVASAKRLPKQATTDPDEQIDNDDDFSTVFEVHEGAVSILIRDIPGATLKEKTVNIGLIVAFAKLQDGIATISSDEVREACRQHGCLDPSNFAAYLKTAKTAFVFSGSGKKQSLKLSVPGRGQAKSLVESLR